jgi:transketolase N-terminal domain/subunit
MSKIQNLYQLRVDVTGFGVAEIVRLALRLRNTLGISVLDIDGDLRDGDTWEQLLAELSIANLVARIQPNTKGIRIATHESRFVVPLKNSVRGK